MANIELAALESVKKETLKLKEKYQVKAGKEREKVNDVCVSIQGEKCYTEDDIFGWYEAGYISSSQYDKYRDKLRKKKETAGETDNMTKSEMICKILDNYIKSLSVNIREIKIEEQEN